MELIKTFSEYTITGVRQKNIKNDSIYQPALFEHNQNSFDYSCIYYNLLI